MASRYLTSHNTRSIGSNGFSKPASASHRNLFTIADLNRGQLTSSYNRKQPRVDDRPQQDGPLVYVKDWLTVDSASASMQSVDPDSFNKGQLTSTYSKPTLLVDPLTNKRRIEIFDAHFNSITPADDTLNVPPSLLKSARTRLRSMGYDSVYIDNFIHKMSQGQRHAFTKEQAQIYDNLFSAHIMPASIQSAPSPTFVKMKSEQEAFESILETKNLSDMQKIDAGQTLYESGIGGVSLSMLDKYFKNNPPLDLREFFETVKHWKAIKDNNTPEDAMKEFERLSGASKTKKIVPSITGILTPKKMRAMEQTMSVNEIADKLYKSYRNSGGRRPSHDFIHNSGRRSYRGTISAINIVLSGAVSLDTDTWTLTSSSRSRRRT